MRRLAFAMAGVVGVVGAAQADTMPQLDFKNPLLISQVVWGAIIFALFYIGVSRFGLPKVDAILEHRAQVIGSDLEQARLSKQQADQAVAELNEARRRAYAESQAAVAGAMQRAKDEAAVRSAEANTRLDQQLTESETRIADARTRAMASLRDVAAETAQAVIARLAQGADSGRVNEAVERELRLRGIAA